MYFKSNLRGDKAETRRLLQRMDEKQSGRDDEGKIIDDRSSFQQHICFQVESGSCMEFKSNPFSKSGSIVRKCMNCGYDIAAHAQDTVSPSSIQKVLESVENIPSLIESNIYLGGFVAAMNMNFLKSKDITLVVNTASGLEQHFPKFKRTTQLYENDGIKSLKLDWQDSVEQQIEWTELLAVMEVMRYTIESGKSILVHCAQV